MALAPNNCVERDLLSAVFVCGECHKPHPAPASPSHLALGIKRIIRMKYKEERQQVFESLVQNSNRIIITGAMPYDVAHRKKVPVLADIRDVEIIARIFDLLGEVENNGSLSWMSSIQKHLNFLNNREMIGYLGLVDSAVLRYPELGDYHLKKRFELLDVLSKV